MRVAWIAAALLLGLPAPASAQGDIQEYTVREGDTCGSIARRVYGNSRRYDRIHEHNPELGPMPHRLAAGTVLRLPAAGAASDPDATVTAARREVRAQRPQAAQWARTSVGQELFQGWRVSTGERSSAELTFRSSSVASIREETLVIVYGGDVRHVRNEGAHAVIRQGAMLSRLGALSGEAPLEVETPTARASLDEGEASVHVEADGTTRVATHAGRPARVRNREGGEHAGGEVQVPAGMGTKVQRARPPTPPRPLPRAPAWAPDQPTQFLGLTDRGGALGGSWLPAQAARTYRVEVARRPDGRDLVFGTEVPSSVTRVELHRLPPGDYYVRVATVDAELFEGRPGEPVALRVVGVTVVPPGAEPPPPLDPHAALLTGLDGFGDVDFEAAPGPVSVLRESRLLSPEGVTCAVGASEPSDALVFGALGEHHLTCVDAEGANIVGMDVRVIAMAARLLADDGSPDPPLTRGAELPVRIALEPASATLDGLSLAAGAGLTLHGVGAHPDGGFRATVRIAADAPGASEVRVVRSGATLAAVDARIRDAPSSEPDAGPAPAVVTRVPEALGLAGYSSFVGLRDERRRGSGIWVSASLASARLGEPEVRVRTAAGVRASFFEERLRLDAMVPLDVLGIAARRADRGSRDVYAAASSLVLDGEGGLGLAVEAGLWAPTSGAQGLDAGRLQIAADASWRTRDGLLTLRTRQAGIFDLVADESLLWASAYGFDVAVAGPLTLGVEGTLTMGSEDRRAWYAGGVAASVGLDLSPVFASLAFRYAVGDDLFPDATLVANVRGSFER